MIPCPSPTSYVYSLLTVYHFLKVFYMPKIAFLYIDFFICLTVNELYIFQSLCNFSLYFLNYVDPVSSFNLP